MWNCLILACQLAVTVTGVADAVSPVNSGNLSAADCPNLGWCQSACNPGQIQADCTDSCFYLADQCCTFCFASSFGVDARFECLGQCPITVNRELQKLAVSKLQKSDSKDQPVADEHKQRKFPMGHKSLMPSKMKARPTPMNRPTVSGTIAHATVTKKRHLRRQQQHKNQGQGHKATATQPIPTVVLQTPMPTVAPAPQCRHCEVISHADECTKQCEEMHERCTTNCLVVIEDPSDRQPCLEHCMALVEVQSKSAFLTPPPNFIIAEATEVTPPPGAPLREPLPPTPRSLPQAAKAVSALHEVGITLPDNPVWNVGPKLRHPSVSSRPALTLALL